MAGQQVGSGLNANVLEVEGFLSLDEAAQKLGTTPGELAREIAEGRVVAVVKNSRSWISPGEVRRLGRSQADVAPSEPDGPETLPTVQATPVVPEVPEEVSQPPSSPQPTQEEKTSQVSLAAVEREAMEDLKRQCETLARRNEELEGITQRLKIGIGETEAALRRSRNAKQNLENDVIGLTDQLKKAQTRSSALEREVQHLTHELERAEEKYANDMRRFRSMERGSSEGPSRQEATSEELVALRQQMQEKDRIISQEYQERAVLRSQLEEKSQKYFELKARYEKEKSEWSEILARELQTHGQLKSQLEQLNVKVNNKTWNPFRRDR